jgi:hypothetical protein
VLGQRRRGRVVEDERRGQCEPGRDLQPVAHLDRGDRVEAELAERAGHRNLLAFLVAQRLRGLGAHEVEQRAVAFGLGQPGEALLELRLLDDLVGQRRAHLGDAAEQRAGTFRGEARREPGPVDVGDGELGLVVGDGLAQHLHRELRRHRSDADPLQRLVHAVIGRHAGVRPRAPRDRRRRQALRPAQVSEPVEVGVGRAVRGLTAAAPARRTRREQDEPGLWREFVQVTGGGDLRVEQRGDVLVLDLVDRGVTGADACRVHDGREVVDAREQSFQRVPIRRVASRDRDAGGRLELCLEFQRAGRV